MNEFLGWIAIFRLLLMDHKQISVLKTKTIPRTPKYKIKRTKMLTLKCFQNVAYYSHGPNQTGGKSKMSCLIYYLFTLLNKHLYFPFMGYA